MVPTKRFSVHVGDSNGAAHLLLTGRFDRSARPAVEEAFVQVPHRNIVLDLDGLTFMDGAAWLAVMDFQHRVEDAGHELTIVNVRGPVREIFARTETEHLLAGSATG